MGALFPTFSTRRVSSSRRRASMQLLYSELPSSSLTYYLTCLFLRGKKERTWGFEVDLKTQQILESSSFHLEVFWLTNNIISVKFKVLGCLMIAIGEPFVNVQEAAKHLQNINGDEFLRQTFLLLPAADCWRREGQSFSRSYWTPLFGVLKARGREEKKWANKEWN